MPPEVTPRRFPRRHGPSKTRKLAGGKRGHPIMARFIDATYVKGTNAAHTNIKFQLLHLAVDFPEIKQNLPRHD